MTPGRARARDLGLAPGKLPAGPANAITDVPGIRVGHATVIEGDGIRTGVTAIVHDALVGADATGRRTLPAGLSVFNGFGKMVGSTQLSELGSIETPVLLTSTLSVFRVADALLSYLRRRPGFEDARTLNPVVAETNDAYLSDVWARAITDEHVRAALDGAAGGPVAEGCVGAGTGTSALGYKAGIGTSSRRCEQTGGEVTVGALVQANFGGELTVLGVPCPPSALDDDHYQDAGNSCVIAIATDARLDSRQLTRLAARAFGGMARVGADFSGRSGDYALAISTAEPITGEPITGEPITGQPITSQPAAGQPATGQPATGQPITSQPAAGQPATGQPAAGQQTAGQQTAGQQAAGQHAAGPGSGGPARAADGGGPVPDNDLDRLFLAAIEATEEAILNSIFMAETTTGYGGRTRHAVSLDALTARVTGRSASRSES